MPNALHSLKNSDYTDRELLFLVNDLANGDGYASTADIADRLGITWPNGNAALYTTKKAEQEARAAYGRRCVGRRYAWMHRFGWVEPHPDEKGLWRLTDIGHDLMKGKLTKTLEKSLDRLSPGDRVLLTRHLGRSAAGDGLEARIMVRREWQHNERALMRNGKG